MKSKDILIKIFRTLEKTYGPQKCFLEHETPLQLLVCAILSAQCTDKKVNSVSPELFNVYPDAESFARADLKKLEKAIKSIGLYHAKARNIIGTCKIICEKHDGKVPSEMETLVELPGVGRKTANVVLGNAFGIPGFPVDTHVGRIMTRLGLAKSENPVKIEEFVNRNMPSKYWTEFSHLLIQHGRNRCRSRKPDCNNCEISKLCRKIL